MAEQARAAYVYDDQMSRHVLAEAHPMKPVRLSYTNALLQGLRAPLRTRERWWSSLGPHRRRSCSRSIGTRT